jgi:hypothetical protein
MNTEVNKLDSLRADLKKLADDVGKRDDQRQFIIPNYLTKSFLEKHTRVADAQELLDKSGFKIDSVASFKAIPDGQWDQYISSVSDFASWEEMLSAARGEDAKHKMGFSS